LRGEILELKSPLFAGATVYTHLLRVFVKGIILIIIEDNMADFVPFYLIPQPLLLQRRGAVGEN
jgi:hypothetical protein